MTAQAVTWFCLSSSTVYKLLSYRPPWFRGEPRVPERPMRERGPISEREPLRRSIEDVRFATQDPLSRTTVAYDPFRGSLARLDDEREPVERVDVAYDPVRRNARPAVQTARSSSARGARPQLVSNAYSRPEVLFDPCRERQTRREVIFAKRKHGKRRRKPRRLSWKSYIGC